MKTKKKIVLWIVAIVVVLAALFCFLTVATAAGGGIGDPTSYLGGSIQLGGNGAPYYGSNLNVDPVTMTANGSFGMEFDPTKASISSANWDFYKNPYYPSQWTATCYIFGTYNPETLPQNQSWSQSINSGGLNINASLNLDSYSYSQGNGVLIQD